MRLQTAPHRFTLCLLAQGGATLTETRNETDGAPFRNHARGQVDAACWAAVRDTVAEALNLRIAGPGLLQLDEADGEELATLLLALEQTSLPSEALHMAERWARLEDCERRWNYSAAMRGDDLDRAGWRMALFHMLGGVRV